MKYEDISIPNKEAVRERLLEVYGRDIGEAECFFSTRNYALILSDGCRPASIRLNVDGEKTRKDVVSELMWVDDLRLTIPTVAQAVPSKNHQIAEEFVIGGNHYCATLFRKANGARLDPSEWNADYFRSAGRLLGQIHKASHAAGQEGFVYRRRRWDEMPFWDFADYPYLDGETVKRCEKLFQEVRDLPEDPDSFGMVHGDFQPTNLYSDWEDLWVFDFDDCCYGSYIYDIAGFFYIAMIEPRYRSGEPRDEAIWGKDGVLEHFRAGYEEYYRLAEEQWALLELYIRLRTALAMGLVSRNPIRPKEQILYILDSQKPLLAEGDLKEIAAGWMREKAGAGGAARWVGKAAPVQAGQKRKSRRGGTDGKKLEDTIDRNPFSSQFDGDRRHGALSGEPSAVRGVAQSGG